MLLRHADEFKSQTEQVQLCERDKCAMQWTQHGGESKAHPRTAEATLAAGAFTSHAPQPLPRAATARATSFKSFAHGFATNVVSVPEHTQRENAPCTTQDDAALSQTSFCTSRPVRDAFGPT